MSTVTVLLDGAGEVEAEVLGEAEGEGLGVGDGDRVS
jgi:hypothetical protein